MAEITIWQHVADIGADQDRHALIRKWLDRGDGVAVYENQDLSDSSDSGCGHRVFMSYGSSQAQIEVTKREHGKWKQPPLRCPDFTGWRPMWRYYLVGVIEPKEVETKGGK